MRIRKEHLNQARRVNPDGILRLARFMGLRIDGMSTRQVVQLIWWRMTRKAKAERGMKLNLV